MAAPAVAPHVDMDHVVLPTEEIGYKGSDESGLDDEAASLTHTTGCIRKHHDDGQHVAPL